MHKHLLCKRTLNHLAELAKQLAVSRVFIGTLHLTAGYCVMYKFVGLNRIAVT